MNPQQTALTASSALLPQAASRVPGYLGQSWWADLTRVVPPPLPPLGATAAAAGGLEGRPPRPGHSRATAAAGADQQVEGQRPQVFAQKALG